MWIGGWLIAIWKVDEEQFLKLSGLDAYMMLRFIGLCLKSACFLSMWGFLVLLPTYASAAGDLVGWNRYTLANVSTIKYGDNLRTWTAVFSLYCFTFYFCALMNKEFKNFAQKRLLYLVSADPSTPPQTHYTVLVENVPRSLRAAPALRAFFEQLFPGDVYSVELPLELEDLEQTVARRRDVQFKLEKAVALKHATGKRQMVYPSTRMADIEAGEKSSSLSPSDSRGDNDQQDWPFQPHPAENLPSSAVLTPNTSPALSRTLGFRGEPSDSHTVGDEELARGIKKSRMLRGRRYVVFSPTLPDVDGISLGGGGSHEDRVARKTDRHFKSDANAGNDFVALGGLDCRAVEKVDAIDYYGRLLAQLNDNIAELQGAYLAQMQLVDTLSADHAPSTDAKRTPGPLPRPELPAVVRPHVSQEDFERLDELGLVDGSILSSVSLSTRTGVAVIADDPASRAVEDLEPCADNDSASPLGDTFARMALQFGDTALESTVHAAQLGLNTMKKASLGIAGGVLEATHTLELLTIGAYYRNSSTAFVTFSSRVAQANAIQVYLSHRHFNMHLDPAPNPRDIIWPNVSNPRDQVEARTLIADCTLYVGAIFWSLVVGSINAISNLDSLSLEWAWLQQYRGTMVYELLQNYLAVLILVIFLALLPYFFDLIARHYEGLKAESLIQDSINRRLFIYQVANVLASIVSTSIANTISDIVRAPESLVTILGRSLPSASLFFANLIIVKTFTAIPYEMLRVWPFISIVGMKLFTDPRKYTRRELRMGIFKDPPMYFGWVYPQIILVLMIMVTYACIAPMLMPLCALFFALSYAMYKYQLLYVYINNYEGGGTMWYAVYNRSMVSLLLGALTLLGYLAIKTDSSALTAGPFYVTIPLPLYIIFVWRRINLRFHAPSMMLSLEAAMDIDAKEELRTGRRTFESNMSTFSPKCYRQPSLAEGRLEAHALTGDCAPMYSAAADVENPTDLGAYKTFDHNRNLQSPHCVPKGTRASFPTERAIYRGSGEVAAQAQDTLSVPTDSTPLLAVAEDEGTWSRRDRTSDPQHTPQQGRSMQRQQSPPYLTPCTAADGPERGANELDEFLSPFRFFDFTHRGSEPDRE
jgi:hypothetical protein